MRRHAQMRLRPRGNKRLFQGYWVGKHLQGGVACLSQLLEHRDCAIGTGMNQLQPRLSIAARAFMRKIENGAAIPAVDCRMR